MSWVDDAELKYWMENGGRTGPVWLLTYPPLTQREMMWNVLKELIRRELERGSESGTTEAS